MPAPSMKLNMNISGLNYSSVQHKFMNLNHQQPQPQPQSHLTRGPVGGLNTSMVSRIFNVRPGCGSCGK